MIKIIDCGSQLTQNIARRVRELGVFTEIVPFYTNSSNILTKGLEGIIISGGQFSVYDDGAPIYQKEILESNVPILGICYGQQSIAYVLGGKVTSAQNREYGQTSVNVIKESPIFSGIHTSEFSVWMSHGDVVRTMPQGFEITSKSESGHIASMQSIDKKIYAVQFHPEVDNTEFGKKMLGNFLHICNALRVWDPTKDYDRIVEEIKEKVKGKVGIGGISGGVDSSTASVLLGKISGRSYHPIFVDNGLLRLNEAQEVRINLDKFDLNIHYVDGSARFLEKLRGIIDPDQKRKIIGYEFIAVFEEEAKRIPNASYLLQGTLYPDVIESVPIYGASSKIKRHHNVGGLPEKMGLEVVEPFRNLFKDEVRKIAEERLDMPKEIVWRHPFPGPGLAIRIKDDITLEKLEILRKADAIFIEELKKRSFYYEISQAFAVLTNIKSTGVMGDAGAYEGIIALNAVVTKDFMTADWYDFKKKDLVAIVNRIVNEVKGINRVVYSVTQKPPATIEWE